MVENYWLKEQFSISISFVMFVLPFFGLKLVERICIFDSVNLKGHDLKLFEFVLYDF